jgi:Fe-S-cluster containining protein
VRDLARVADPGFYEARGFRPAMVDGRRIWVLWAETHAPCPAHSQETGCGIYAERPATCAEFPTHPRDIVATPCSYWFTQGETAIGGDTSPHPMTLDAYLAMETPA